MTHALNCLKISFEQRAIMRRSTIPRHAHYRVTGRAKDEELFVLTVDVISEIDARLVAGAQLRRTPNGRALLRRATTVRT